MNIDIIYKLTYDYIHEEIIVVVCTRKEGGRVILVIHKLFTRGEQEGG